MSNIRETEEIYYTEVTNVCVRFFELYSKGELETSLEITDELHSLLRDKTTITNVITAAHDMCLLKIDGKVRKKERGREKERQRQSERSQG